MTENDSPPPRQDSTLSERAIEDYLVANIKDLDPTLSFESRQLQTEVGIIDILAREESGGMVVVELKAGLADEDAVAQIARYLGWMRYTEEHSGTPPWLRRRFRAILLAGDFTKAAWCAAATIPDLKLYKFKLTELSFSGFHIV